MKKSICYMLSAALALCSAISYADHHEHTETEHYEMKADVNNDGKVSYDEFKAAREKHMQEHFKRRDLNGDGFIDENEKKAAKKNWKQYHKNMKKDCKKKDSDEANN